MKNILITGITGFLGSNIAFKLIEEGYNVYGIVRKGALLSNLSEIVERITLYTINDEMEIFNNLFREVNIDCVIHAAAYIINEHKPDDVDNIIDSNILFGSHILEAMKNNSLKNFINIGTSWQNYNKEEYNPVCLYAASKEAFEKIIEYYVEAEKFTAITIKLFDNYGENDTRQKLMNLLRNNVNSTAEILLSPGEQKINLLHISDVIKGIIMCMSIIEKGSFRHMKYTLRADSDISVKELVALIETIIGKKLNIKWGGKNYRKREIMEPYSNCPLVPGWKQEIDLKKGLERFFGITRK